MKTDAMLDETLVAEAQRLGGHATEQEAVNTALQEYVQRHKRLSVLELVGKIEYYPDYDYKALRRRDTP